MTQDKQPRRRIGQGTLVATTNKSLLNCIRTGKIQVKYQYNSLSFRVIDRQFVTSY